MRNWNTTWCVGPLVLKVFGGVAARDRFGNELEASNFLWRRGIPVPRRICSSTSFKSIVYARARGTALDVHVQCPDESMSALHDAAEHLAHRTAVPADKPLGWLHRPSNEVDMVSVLRADLVRLSSAARHVNASVDLRDEIDLLTSIRPVPASERILCLADFSPKNLLVDGYRWTLVDLESAIVATPDVFWAKAAANMARDIGDPALAFEQASWFWGRVRCEPLGRAAIVWALARMLYFRAVVGGPSKDPTSALEAVRSGSDVHDTLAALADA